MNYQTNNNLPDVINLHFTDRCNYRCLHCFGNKEVKILKLDEIKTIVDNIKKYFECYNLNGRINLVGGEIFTCEYLQEIIDYIYRQNIKISIVTNGFLLKDEFIRMNKEKIESIGISVDSINPETNLKIGRCAGKKTLEKERIIELSKTIKDNSIKLKINICVSKNNVNENMFDFIKEIKPDRFKILQMMIVNGKNDEQVNLKVTDEEFKEYCKKYLGLKPIIENDDDLRDSYLMIDSAGDFSYNKEKESVGNLLKEDFTEIIKRANINIEKFNKRYNKN